MRGLRSTVERPPWIRAPFLYAADQPSGTIAVDAHRRLRLPPRVRHASLSLLVYTYPVIVTVAAVALGREPASRAGWPRSS